MKNNLKTFPKGWNSNAMRAWKKDFEKELREYIRFVDGLRAHPKFEATEIKYEIYKEILGE